MSFRRGKCRKSPFHDSGQARKTRLSRSSGQQSDPAGKICQHEIKKLVDSNQYSCAACFKGQRVDRIFNDIKPEVFGRQRKRMWHGSRVHYFWRMTGIRQVKSGPIENNGRTGETGGNLIWQLALFCLRDINHRDVVLCPSKYRSVLIHHSARSKLLDLAVKLGPSTVWPCAFSICNPAWSAFRPRPCCRCYHSHQGTETAALVDALDQIRSSNNDTINQSYQ